MAALISGPIIYGLFQTFTVEVHFLIQVAITFLLVLMIMGIITFCKPLDTPRELPVRENIEIRTMPEVKLAGGLVLAAVVAFYFIFW